MKPQTIQLVLSLAMNRNWCIRQLDIKNTFLHGVLNAVVYMKQPPGFIDKQFPNHVCLLHKSIYGLRQSPRTWFDDFSKALLELGFKRSRADTSMFIHYASHGMTIFLIYVDDILVTGASNEFLSSLISHLNSRFEVKDLGQLSYFLGIEVRRNGFQMQLSQTKYAIDF